MRRLLLLLLFWQNLAAGVATVVVAGYAAVAVAGDAVVAASPAPADAIALAVGRVAESAPIALAF